VEAIKLYKQENLKELHVEALLRFGHFNATCGSPKRRPYALDCLSLAVQASNALTAQDRV
jgi:hypothetical protein